MKFLIIPIAALLMIPTVARADIASPVNTFTKNTDDTFHPIRNHRRHRDEDRRRCSNKITSAKGAQRPTESWARRKAVEAWMREVRYDLGETYLNFKNAKNARIICNPSSIGGFQIRCEARGIACQSE